MRSGESLWPWHREWRQRWTSNSKPTSSSRQKSKRSPIHLQLRYCWPRPSLSKLANSAKRRQKPFSNLLQLRRHRTPPRRSRLKNSSRQRHQSVTDLAPKRTKAYSIHLPRHWAHLRQSHRQRSPKYSRIGTRRVGPTLGISSGHNCTSCTGEISW